MKISATDFKAKCLSLLDHLPAEGLSITKRGRVVAVVYPEHVDNSDWIGSMPEIEVLGDIFSTGVEWDAQS